LDLADFVSFNSKNLCQIQNMALSTQAQVSIKIAIFILFNLGKNFYTEKRWNKQVN
jgi:hypothetical protein